MKVLVIGGLGYLGSGLVSFLEKEDLELHIMDCNLFNSRYEPSSDIKLIKQNILD